MRKTSITTNEQGFELSDGDQIVGRVAFRDITKVTAYKCDQLTTDLICCDVTGNQSLVWSLHEELPGFDNLMERFAELPGFRREWRNAVLLPPFVENSTEIFSRIEL
ncbi:MAG: hypothetical protein H0T56_03180 [Pseudaminobacter sp.]|nr:hypothetical protein [Pseudaminobacter sp.]